MGAPGRRGEVWCRSRLRRVLDLANYCERGDDGDITQGRMFLWSRPHRGIWRARGHGVLPAQIAASIREWGFTTRFWSAGNQRHWLVSSRALAAVTRLYRSDTISALTRFLVSTATGSRAQRRVGIAHALGIAKHQQHG